VNVTLELDLDTIVGDEGGTLLGLIVNATAARLVSDLKREPAYPSLKDRVSAIRDEEIRMQLAPVVEESVTASVQPTDSFGAPKGEARTLREIILDAAKKELTAPRERDYGRGRETLVQYVIRTEVDRHITNELQAAIKEAKAEVVKAVREKGSEVLTETITRLAR
jgi:hypothetical protein